MDKSCPCGGQVTLFSALIKDGRRNDLYQCRKAGCKKTLYQTELIETDTDLPIKVEPDRIV